METKKTKTRHFLMTFMGADRDKNSVSYNEVYVDCGKLTREAVEKARQKSIVIMKDEHGVDVPFMNLINVVELDG